MAGIGPKPVAGGEAEPPAHVKHTWDLLCTSIDKRHVSWCHRCGTIKVNVLKMTEDAKTYFATWYIAMGSKHPLKHTPPCYPVKLHEECQGLAIALEAAIARLEKADSDNAFLRKELKELMP